MVSIRSIAIIACALGAALPAQDATRTHADELVRKLDDAFNRRDQKAYMAAFDLDHHKQHHARIDARIGQLLREEGATATSVVRDFDPRGAIGVALVETAISSGTATFVQHSLTAFRTANDKPIGIVAVALEKAANKKWKQGQFSCAACNYTIGFRNTWLAVPMDPAQSGCMEALQLISLTQDIHLQVAVRVGEKPLSATEVLRLCTDTARKSKRARHEEQPEIVPWRPNGFAAATPMPAGMECLRCACHCAAGDLAELNLIVLGRLRYLIVVRGGEKAVGDHRREIDAVLNSFTLLEPGLSAQQMVAKAITMHTGGGTLTANKYDNKTYGVSIRGPADWRSTLRPGPYLFQLTYTCPTDASRLRVRALRPRGNAWSRATADSVVVNTTRGKCKVGGWQKSGGFSWRDVPTSWGFMRFAMRPDILVIMEGKARGAASKAAILAAMASLSSSQ